MPELDVGGEGTADACLMIDSIPGMAGVCLSQFLYTYMFMCEWAHIRVYTCMGGQRTSSGGLPQESSLCYLRQGMVLSWTSLGRLVNEMTLSLLHQYWDYRGVPLCLLFFYCSSGAQTQISVLAWQPL